LFIGVDLRSSAADNAFCTLQDHFNFRRQT
jgi:hypothetical protein